MYSDYYGYGNDYGLAVDSMLSMILIFSVVFLIFFLAVSIVQIIAQWKIYKKAGKGGWEAIVPFYCNWVLVEIAGLKWYWFLFFFAPLVSEFINLEWLGWLAYLFGTFNIFYNISKRFNKGIGFAICLTLFTPICMAILGFSKKAVYDKNIPVSENGIFGTPNSNTNNTQTVNQQPEQQNVQPVEPTVNQSSTPVFCTNCGNRLMPNSKFCTNCGKQI